MKTAVLAERFEINMILDMRSRRGGQRHLKIKIKIHLIYAEFWFRDGVEVFGLNSFVSIWFSCLSNKTIS